MVRTGTRQVQLAEKLDVSQVSISKWLSGRTPRARYVILLRDLCGIPIDTWLQPAEDEEPSADESGSHQVVDAGKVG